MNFNLSLWKIDIPLQQKPGKQLLEFISHKILDGGLREDDRLPSQRDFATLNKLNVNTVKRVYNQLNARGLIKTKPGMGTFVSYDADEFLNKHENKRFTRQLPIALPNADVVGSSTPAVIQDFLSIGLDVLDPSFTPFQQMSKYLRLHQNKHSRRTQFQQIRDFEALEFRESIRKYLKETRGFKLDAGNLHLIFSREQAMRQLLAVLLSPGTAVINTCGQERQLKLMLNEMDVREHILQTTAPDFIGQLEALLQNTVIRLLIVRPQCGYPEGNCLDIPTCERLLALAKEYRFYILEEDPYHEFWYGHAPFRPLCNYDHEGHVIYLGVLSQLSIYMFNTYVVCASEVFIDLLKRGMRQDYPFRNLIKEKAIAEMLDAGEMWLLVKEVRYKKEQEKAALEFILNSVLTEHVAIQASSSGLSLWILFADTLDLGQMMRMMQAEKVQVPYHPAQEKPGKKCHKMRLGFGTYNRPEALDAAKVLLRLLEKTGSS